MDFFKYKWQAYIFFSIFFSMLLFINYLAFRLIPFKHILITWGAGFLSTGLIFIARSRHENGKK
jgi:hypothetical protein